MLNRRSLRIKVMQSLYAVQKCEEADFELAKAFIDDYFAPDLNSMEVQDKDQLKRDAKIARRTFIENFGKSIINESENSTDAVRKAVNEARSFYQEQVNSDKSFIQKNMLEAVHKLLENYYLSIMLVLEFAKINKEDVQTREKRSKDTNKAVFASEMNLANNKLVDIMRQNSALNNEFIRHKISWEEEELTVRQWYREVLKKESFYTEYTQLANPSFEDDRALIDKIFKQLVIKNAAISNFMEERDLYWAENKSALKSMLKKTLKSIADTSDHVELIALSANWEDDSDFFKKLFKETLNNDAEYGELVAKFTKNWSKERITDVDMIILKMAVCEMLNFPSIPVKVTINEYIELSKNYSTQKSKVFINGMLDKISTELNKSAKIKKSGRGLMDNK